ncbi:MAG: hypothetical protein A3F11_08765 [Gammaproteobacteria bacterium RIFCSPHIGHO2_12_FULL_37_14]|nr:MAG: hypothetical protein A3F11_08765 [Gammaproteobacteria bacterium RIFCSPHIGHO2_12_FULL_37_14]
MEKKSTVDIEKELIAITQQLLNESGQPHKREIKLNASLSRHLGIDSLARAELFQRIEKKFKVTIPDQILADADSLNEVINYLTNASLIAKKIPRPVVANVHAERSHVDPTQILSLTDVLLTYGEKSPNKTHVCFQKEDYQEEIITYQQLLASSLCVAQGLRERGLNEGETVAIMLPTQAEFFYSFFGVLFAGGIPVPIYPPFRAHMLEAYTKTEARILRNAEVRILITFTQAEKLSHLLKAFIPSLKEVITVDALLQSSPLASPFRAKSTSYAFIQYTSGSTSDPKGVLLTHANLLANIRAYGKAINVIPEDVSVSWLPLYHDMGLIGLWLGSLYHGIPLILMTPFAFLNHPERWLWAIHYHRGTLSGAPNFAYELCIRKIDHALIEGLDLSSWRVAANGAEKIYPRTLEKFAEKFSPYGLKRNAILPVYGLAESTVSLTIPPLGREFRIDRVNRAAFETESTALPSQDKHALSFVSCGLPIQDHEIRIVDDENKILAERHVGNLQFRGPSSMQGYYHNSKATQAVYHEGWWDTGDLAYLVDGELFITGRRKDLIIKAGRNLYPVEIEELVGSISGIRQGCVTAFGIDTDKGTEQLIVVAETQEKNRAKRQVITQAIQTTMSENLDIIPDNIVLVAPRTVPKTSSGKLQRAACKTMYLEGNLGSMRMPAWMQISKLALLWSVRQSISFLTAFIKFFYTLYVAIIVVIGLTPVYFIVRLASREFAAKVCRVSAKWLRRICFCPLRVTGLENLTKTSPILFVANHSSYVDSLILIEILPAQICFVGKKELLATPILRTFMRKLGYLSVDRLDLSKGIDDTKLIEQALNLGQNVLIFPEGTFGYASGLRPFRLGAFKVSIETKTAICPIALQGTRTILRAGEKLLRPNSVTVTISDPIMPSGSAWQDVTQLRHIVRQEIAKHCGEPLLDFIAAQTVAPSRGKSFEKS